MSKEKVTSELTDIVVDSKSAEGKDWTIQKGLNTTETLGSCVGITCSCNKNDMVLQGKVLATKLTLIDKIKEGIDNGHNCDYICQLSKIYSNLSL